MAYIAPRSLEESGRLGKANSGPDPQREGAIYGG